MNQIGTVTLTGFVTGEPKLRFTKVEGIAVTHVRVGCTTRKMDRDTGEWKDANTSFFTVNCWRKLAVNVTASLHKGQPVIVKGRFRTRTWMEEGRPRTEVEIDADTIGHDLAVGWAMFQRGPRAYPQLSDELAEGETRRAGLDEPQAGAEHAGGHDEGREGGSEDPGPVRPAPGPDVPSAPQNGHIAPDPEDMADSILDEQAIADELERSFEADLDPEPV